MSLPGVRIRKRDCQPTTRLTSRRLFTVYERAELCVGDEAYELGIEAALGQIELLFRS